MLNIVKLYYIDNLTQETRKYCEKKKYLQIQSKKNSEKSIS